MELLQNLMSTSSASEKEVNESIATLVDRLSHSTLLSDRRAAVLGLKSFSRQYREIVVANALKNLVATLQRDSIDLDTVKAVLETLLILFIRGEGDQDLTRDWISQQSRLRNGKYPSPSLLVADIAVDQFSLWIADELTQSVSNIDTLVDLLEADDMHIKLYSLQLLQALCSTRPTRTKELILKSPLAVSKLCSSLDDPYEPIRNEAILLLMGVVKDNFNIQKLVAFENTFDKLYKIIEEEGGVEGNIVVQDCLSLVSNLLRYNATNQKFFLETSCMPKLAELIHQPLVESELGPIVWNQQRLQNIITTMDTCRLFVLEGTQAIQQAQQALVDSDILMLVLRLVFSLNIPNAIRVNALLTTADIIRSNSDIQLQFSQIDVPYLDPSLPSSAQKFEDVIPVIDALLSWALYVNSVHLFDLRIASSIVLHAYFMNNDEAKYAFIKDQKYTFNKMNGMPVSDSEGEEDGDIEEDDQQSDSIEEPNGNGKESLSDSTKSLSSSPLPENSPKVLNANLFQTLVNVDNEMQLNPYKVWFCSIIFLYLFEDYPEGRDLALSVKIGDESADEDVLNIVEAIGQALCSSLRFHDPRVPVAYMMLLSVWLWENFQSVDMFLNDSSVLDQLLAYIAETVDGSTLVQGMVTVLLGIVYEFTRKDSPIGRVQLNSLLRSRIGDNAFSLKIQQFEQTSEFASFDPESVLSPEKDDTGLPQVYFDPIFVRLVKENSKRIRGAIGHDPHVEPVRNLNYSAYEKIQAEFSELSDSYKKFQEDSDSLVTSQQLEIQRLVSDYDELSKKFESTKKEFEKLQNLKSELDNNFTRSSGDVAKLNEIKAELEAQLSSMRAQYQEAVFKITSLENANQQITEKLSATEQLKTKAEDGINKMSRELMQLTRDKESQSRLVKNMEKEAAKVAKVQSKLENQLKTTAAQHAESIATLEGKIESLNSDLKNRDENYNSLRRSYEETVQKSRLAEQQIEQLQEKYRVATELIEKLKSEKDKESKEFSGYRETTDANLKEMSLTIENLTTSNEELKNNNHALLSQQSELQQSLSDVRQQLETLRLESKKEVDDSKLLVEGLKSKLEQSEVANTELKAKISALETNLEENKSQGSKLIESHNKAIDNLKLDHKSAVEKLVEESLKHKSLHEETSEKFISLETTHSEVSKKLEEKAALVSKLESQCTELGGVQEKLSQEIEELTKKNSETELELNEKSKLVTELQAEKASLEDSLSQKEAEIKKLSDELTELQESSEKQALALNKSVDSITKSFEDTKSEKDQVKKDLNELKAQTDTAISSLKHELGEMKESRNTVLEEKKSLESTISMISLNMEAKDEESKKLSKKLSTLESSLKEVEKSKKDLEGNVQKLTKELSDTKKKVSDNVSALIDSKKEVKKHLSTISSLNSKLEDQKEVSQERIFKLESEIESLKDDLSKKVSELEQERELLTGSSEAVVKEYSDKISKLEERLKSVQEQKTSEISKLEAAKAELSSQNKQLNGKIGDLESDLTDANETNESLKSHSELQKETASTLEAQVSECKAKLEESQKELKLKEKEFEEKGKRIEDLEAESSSVSVELQKTTKKLKELEESASASSEGLKTREVKLAEKSDEIARLEELLKEFKLNHESERNNLLETHKSEKQKLLESHNAVIDGSKKELDEKVKDLSVKNEQMDQLAKKCEDLEKELETLKLQNSEISAEKDSKLSEIEQLGKKHADTVTKLEADLKDKTVEAEKLSKETVDLRTKSETLETKLKSETEKSSAYFEKLKAENSELVAEKDQLKAENDKMTTSLESMKQKIADLVPRSDLDDLMLVMSELDDKNKQLKKKLKSLGEEVSSDEEGDDEDDEDDEDDDDDDDEGEEE